MVKTTDVASDRAYDPTKTVLPKEVAQGVYMRHAPSLKALKLMHLMIATAGGRMADDVRHEFRLADVRKIDGMGNHSRSDLVPLFEELRAAVITHDDPNRMAIRIGGILDEALVDYRNEVGGDTVLSWSFGQTFRRMAEESNHWAIIDRQTVFHLGSKYSVLLFQYISALVPYRHINSKRFTVEEMRAVFGVPDGKVKRFADLNRDVLQPALKEISHISRFVLRATPHKVGRTVAEIEISWEIKEDLTTTKRELAGSKIGRKARRTGTVEAAVVPFPASGGLPASDADLAHWRRLYVDNVAKLQGGHLPDSKLVCDAFRAKVGDLGETNLEKRFVGFCKRWHP